MSSDFLKRLIESDGADPIHPRAARLKLAAAQNYLAYLELARRERMKLAGEATVLDAELTGARLAVENLSVIADARIDPRRRLPKREAIDDVRGRPEYLLFLDECGSHVLQQEHDPFPVFCLCGIIVDASTYPSLDRKWKAWKQRWLQSRRVIVHEPDLRKLSGRFFDPDKSRAARRVASLNTTLHSLSFFVIAAAIHKREVNTSPNNLPADDFLPASTYLVCLDFILERFTHFLCHVGNGAQGRVFAESRGLREDAEVNHEYLRLHLEGTRFIPESQFRGYLHPSIRFERKGSNSSGLQFADVLARPIADKVRNPESDPPRWDIAVSKFYDGGQERKGSYGLKVFPTTGLDLFGDYP